MKTGIWISYDLGIKGDYPALFAWLEDHGARECGDSVAFLRYEHTGPLLAGLRSELLPIVEGNRSARLYVVYQKGKNQAHSGTFLYGNRKAAPWTGFGAAGEVVVDK